MSQRLLTKFSCLKNFLTLSTCLATLKLFFSTFPKHLLGRKFPSLSPLKYVFDSVLCNYQQRNLIKKIYAIKLCVIFESLLFSAFLSLTHSRREKVLWRGGCLICGLHNSPPHGNLLKKLFSAVLSGG